MQIHIKSWWIFTIFICNEALCTIRMLLETSLIKTHAADIKLRVNHFLVIRVISAAFIRHLDVFVRSREEGVGDFLYSDIPPT